MFNIILSGPPGSGKGTQAERIVHKYNCIQIALGALLRKKIADNAPDKALIEGYINHGQLVPDEVSFKVVEELVQANLPRHSLLFDGFPRTILQTTFLDNLLMQYHTQIDGVIFLDVPNEVLMQRLQNRARIEKRLDDQDENKIKTRMHIYQQENLAIVNHYKAQKKLYQIEGIQNVDQITDLISTIIDTIRQ